MFIIFKNKELEAIISRLHANMSNNYKDNAQDNLVELEKKYNELLANKKLSSSHRNYYGEEIARLKEEMKGFTHKDQKPYWTKD